jgi:multidrug efflux pump subunit AcrA (membrane-fusion protein)
MQRRFECCLLPRSSIARLACLIGMLAALVAPGCEQAPQTATTSVADPPTVRVIPLEARNIIRVVGQPSFVEAYERTSIFPKMTAYIEKWYVDIGDKVKKNQVLADLFVPEIREDFNTKQATVALDQQRVELAKKAVVVAGADVRSAEARLRAAKAILGQYDAEVIRWDSEVQRLTREKNRGVVDAQVLLESQKQLKSSIAARDAADADIATAQADLESKSALLEKDQVAVNVAKADVDVATSDWKRMEAWVGYLKLYAPFDGVVVARNANTGDFVLPATGDPTADKLSPDLSPGNKAAPIYVVDRTDVVRIFVDIPEHDANFVRVGAKATVLAKAFRDQPIVATVTRTSWALNVKSRTLRAEIDLPNTASSVPDDLPEATREALMQVKLPTTDSQILPGMYAYGKVIIERPQVLALPETALTRSGDRTYCWLYEDGKSVKTEIQTGVSDGTWVEVTNHRRTAKAEANQPNGTRSIDAMALLAAQLDDLDDWVPFDGSEQAILGDLSILIDGAPVNVAREAGTKPSSATGQPPAQ